MKSKKIVLQFLLAILTNIVSLLLGNYITDKKWQHSIASGKKISFGNQQYRAVKDDKAQPYKKDRTGYGNKWNCVKKVSGGSVCCEI